MPEDAEKEKGRYSNDTIVVVERIRKILKHNLEKKGTLAALFEPLNPESQGMKDQDANMRGPNKRSGGYSQFYSEDRGASAYKPSDDLMGANKKNEQEQDPMSFSIER